MHRRRIGIRRRTDCLSWQGRRSVTVVGGGGDVRRPAKVSASNHSGDLLPRPDLGQGLDRDRGDVAHVDWAIFLAPRHPKKRLRLVVGRVL